MSFRFRRSLLLLLVAISGIVQSQGATDRPSDYYSTKQGYGQDEPDTKAYDNTGNESSLSDNLDPESSDVVYQPMESSESDESVTISDESVNSGEENIASDSDREITGTEGGTLSTDDISEDVTAVTAYIVDGDISEDATSVTASIVDGDISEDATSVTASIVDGDIREDATSVTASIVDGDISEDATSGGVIVDSEATNGNALTSEDSTSGTDEEGGESVVWYDDYANKIEEEDNESVNGEEEQDEPVSEGEEVSESNVISGEEDNTSSEDKGNESDIREEESTFADIDDNVDSIGNEIVMDPLYSSSMSSTDDSESVVDSILNNEVAATPDPNSTPGQEVFVHRVLEYDGADGGVDTGAGAETATQGPTQYAGGATAGGDYEGGATAEYRGATDEAAGPSNDYNLLDPTYVEEGPTSDGMGGPSDMIGDKGDEIESEDEIVEESQLITVIEEAEEHNLIGATKTLSSIVIVMALGGLLCIAYVGRRKFLFYKKEQEYKNLLGDDYSEDELECGNKLKY